MLSQKGRATDSGSTKQRLNTRSSTKSEIVAVHNFHPKRLWTLRFMECQEYLLEMKLYQDNKSVITLETKGRLSLGKRSCTISIHYFAMKDSADRDGIELIHCPTDSMVGDFFNQAPAGK